MDEVDIDNMEDLNELEARLYAQIHHEATEESNVDPSLQNVQNNENNVLNTAANNNDAGSNAENYETSSNTNRILSRRYWATGEHAVKQQQPNNHQQQTQNSQQQHQQNTNKQNSQQQHQQNTNKQRLIRNPFKQPSHQQQHQNNMQQKHDSLTSTTSASNKSQNHQQSKQIENQSNSASTTSKNAENVKSSQNNNKSNAEKTPTSTANKSTTPSSTTVSENPTQDTPTTSNENKKNKNTKTNNEQQSANAKQKPAAVAEKSNIKVNPVVKWMEKNKNQNNKKQSNNNNNNANSKNSKNSSNNNKQGPFGKQQQKLQKAKRLEDKKQKSKKAKNNAAAIANKLKPTEIIDLDTENESDSSDVIVIPTEPPPTYTVEDSGDEDDKEKVTTIIAQEENALDSTDVQMSSTSSSFIKPQQISKQTLANSAEQRLEDSSRCTSPCSIQSSDDFIGQNDRSRLLAGASGMADDEDLLVLTNDMNSLLEVPDNKKQTDDHDKDRENEESPLDISVERVQPEENMETNDSLEFATPKTSKQATRPRDYRVDQSQFRALDVYESESDITDSVYSKGANKSATVIRQIDTSSDEVEDIGICSQRTKRLRKRRASSSNKESDPNNENSASSSDNEDHGDDEDDNKLLRTNIPFIARGPAVERSKPRKRSRTLSTCSPIVQKRKAAKTLATGGHMSDNEFIATLNNLAQGQEDELKEQTEQEQLQEEDEEADESETENVPTARDIAEKILARHNEKETANKSVAEEMAVPEDVLNDLDKVFETIDQMDKREARKQQISTSDDAVKISDSSDSDREKHFIYKSVPNEDAQIIEYSPDTTKKDKQATTKQTYAENGSPIYNVVYSRGQRKAGGIGWNEEMRKFYNDSWNGEHFILSKVLQKMNPHKNLWKIYTEDRFNIKTKRHNNMKCTNCCEFGHMRSKCKRPKKPMICYMCGDSGHHEPRCPNTICLRCGNKTQVFTKSCNACSYQNRLICPICKIRGHSLDYCPDKWRRYHSTTEPNTYPNSSITYNPRKYCCICGGRGHLSDNCRSAVRFMEYPAIVSTVKSHQKSYSDIVVKTPHNGIALNLMYEPCEEYKFDLVDRTTLQKYYGRFLKAVNLDHLLKRKRHVSATTTTAETPDSTAKKAKRLSKRYEANPYSKIGTANQKSGESSDNAPNQVQEISESGNTEEPDQQQEEEEHNTDEQPQVIDIDENSIDTTGSDNEVELVESTMEDVDSANIQLNIVNERTKYGEQQHDGNFKSPKKVTSTTTSSKKQAEPPVVMDSDSNYSFSEHFDVPATAVEEEEEQTSENVEKQQEENTTEQMKDPREMEPMPDYIPLIDSTEDQVEEISDNENMGISRRFVPAETDEEMEEEEHDKRKTSSPVPELPCEAKIYLTHFHSKYLLSPVGNAFLVKTSRAHKLKARLDFTSIGHVLVIFGMPSDQDKFQRELLLKYRELEDESNQKQTQSNLNVPKRTDVLIKFLRENITQLLNNLGNVNHLLKRLQFLERQQSKSGYKLAEKVRRSLNMILVGQAGLQDGTMHLDKLLMSLKTLMNDYNSEDVTPPQLRSEITDHWKVIFTPYRHENYQQLVNAYNKLISKNRVPKLEIDPILLGHKVLDTSLTEEQKQKLEQPRTPTVTNSSNNSTETPKQIVPNPLNQKNSKLLKRKHNTGATSPSPTVTNTTPTTHKTKTPTSRPVSPVKISQTNTTRGDNAINTTNVKNKTTSNTPATSTPKTSKTANNTPTTAKAKSSTNTTPNANKSKQNTNSTNVTPTTNTSTTPTAAPKKQTPKIMPPPPFINPENRSTVSTTIQEVSDKWKSTCDTILTQISSDKPSGKKDGRTLDSKLPSTFWSRESMRYLDDCVRLAASRPQVVEKLKRVQNKSKNGQLSYNDYLAVIKLHTALNGK